MVVTFKELNNNSNVDKTVKKVGLSLGIIFSKDDIDKFKITYNSKIRLNNAEIIIDE
jgi:long-subunit fatty acid transport protein